MTEQLGEGSPFVSVAHRSHRARLATAFGLGVMAGAAIAWLVILGLALAGRAVG